MCHHQDAPGKVFAELRMSPIDDHAGGRVEPTPETQRLVKADHRARCISTDERPTLRFHATSQGLA